MLASECWRTVSLASAKHRHAVSRRASEMDLPCEGLRVYGLPWSDQCYICQHCYFLPHLCCSGLAPLSAVVRCDDAQEQIYHERRHKAGA